MMKHLLKPRQKTMSIIAVEVDGGPHKLGKFPHYLTKSLKYPGKSRLGAVARGGYLAYKYSRVYAKKYWYLYKNRIYFASHGAALGGGLITGGLSSLPLRSTTKRQTRGTLVKSSRRRFGRQKRSINQCCTTCGQRHR